MALKKREISLNISGKLDTKSESKLVPMEGVLVSENIEYSKIGTIKKCDGLEAVSTTLYTPLTEATSTIDTTRPMKFITDFSRLSLLRSPSNRGISVFSDTENKWISDNRSYGPVSGDTNFSQHSTPNYREKIIDSGEKLGFRYNDIVYSSKFNFYIASGEIKDIDGTSKTYLFKLDSDYNVIFKFLVSSLSSPNTCARVYIDDSDNSISNCKIVLYIVYNTQLWVIKYSINFVLIGSNAFNYNASVGLMVAKINPYDNLLYILFQTTDYKFFIAKADSTGTITATNVIVPVGGVTILQNSTKHDLAFTSNKIFIFFMEDYTLPANGGNLYLRAISLDHSLVVLNNSYRFSGIGNLSDVKYISCCEDLGNLGKIQIIVNNHIGSLNEYTSKFTYSNVNRYFFVDFFYFDSSNNTILRNLTMGIQDLITSVTMISDLVCSLVNGSYKFFFIAHSGTINESDGVFLMEQTDLLIEFELMNGYTDRSKISPVARYNIDNGIAFSNAGVITTIVKDRLLFNGSKLITNSLYFSKALVSETIDIAAYGSRTFGMKVIEFDFSEDIVKSVQKLGKQVIVSGAIPTLYDGLNYYIQGFVYKPFLINLDVVLNPTTGYFQTVGNYQVYIVAEFINMNGEIELSRISNSLIFTIAARSDVYIYTIPQTLSMKSLSAIKVYVLKPASTIPTIYNYFDKSLGYTYDTTAPFRFKIGFSGFGVSPVPEPLYTQGGDLENDSLPPSKFLISANDRIFSVNANDNNISYSKVYLQDAGLNFSSFLFKSIQAENGILSIDINAMGLLDGKIILFKENSIYAFSGDGPSNDGANDSFTTPQKISVEVGCSEPTSLVSMPLGLMFKSLKGIYLLDRGLNSRYIGAEVEAYNSETITSATLNQNKNQIVFTTSSDKSLVYDYLIDRWTVYKGYNGQDSIVFNDKLYLLKDYNVFKQSSTDFRVNAANNPIKITTAWYKVSGIENFGRVYRGLILGKFKSFHQLIVKTYYDYDETLFETFTLDPLITDNIYQYQINFSRQKCQSVKFEIYDISTAGTYEGLELTDISLVVGKKVGLNKLSDIRTYKGA